MDFGFWMLDSSFVLRDVIAAENPVSPQGRETVRGVAIELRIAPGAAAIVDAFWFVDFDAAADGFGGREGNLAHGDAEIRVKFARDVNAP